MNTTEWSADTAAPSQEQDGRGLPATLYQAAQGRIRLDTSFQVLARYQEELARTSADLLERETWALTAVLTLSEPIWHSPTRPTLLFTPARPGEPYLELGHFAHLGDLLAPSADERGLIEASTLCWARVSPHHGRQRAGQTGALGCSYVPIPAAEAVGMLGLGRILDQVEAATCMAGQALLTRALAQQERQARLLAVERMLGWAPAHAEASLGPALPAGMRLLLLLGNVGVGAWALGAALVGLAVVLVCLLPV